MKHSARRLKSRGSVLVLLEMAGLATLVASMLALNHELTTGPSRYLRSVQVDYWIAQKGAKSTATSSFVDPAILSRLKANGYNADGMLEYFTYIGSRQITYHSYQPGGILSPKLAAGRQVQNDQEVVVDHVLANSLDVHLGDSMSIGGQKSRVVGLSEDTNSIGKEIVFMNHKAMARIVGRTTFGQVAIRLAPGQTWPAHGIPLRDYSVFTHPQFIKSNDVYWEETITPLFNLIIAIAVVIGVGLMGVSFKRDIDHRLSEIAILRAIGASVGQVFGVEALSSLVLVFLGTALSLILSWIIILVANNFVPGVTASLGPRFVLYGLLACMAVCAVALVGPYRLVRKLRPVELFRRQ
jgi:ABC-type antimicrobial peptide transport system permease subunit